MEQCIKQNNAVEIYEDYFDGGDETTECEKPDSKTLHVFRDPSTTYKRPVAGISWCVFVCDFRRVTIYCIVRTWYGEFSATFIVAFVSPINLELGILSSKVFEL